ncbi:ABC transporter sub-family G-like protein 1 [Leptotrombidium deliense]|uniref:ABC transporter sub-family G-like protein 1 n=1 Tax=Leptotrombidium deliense TaxID=299467 RepID=A0A443SCZ6_9ACAR|nr:ABC transporter sub-family G-like protein 1 [Leptotrombidium deliense]
MFELAEKKPKIQKIAEDALENEKEAFEIIWTNLSYKIECNLIQRMLQRIQGFHNPINQRTILNRINGSVKSGELVAFIGPSGAGKSTLMECIVERRNKGKSGIISIYGNSLTNVKMSFIAQKNDALFRLLTVRETIYYAARLQCSSKTQVLEYLFDDSGHQVLADKGSTEYCNIITDRVISDLGLEVCENNRLPSCSGGQLKRLAIAQQLVLKPRILVLDEPTSGLDSSSCIQVIEILLKLTTSKPQIAVMATIHQPSYKVLNMFHKLYIIAKNGDCVYEGKPENLVNHIEQFGVVCPLNYNPAELMIEIACGDHGERVIKNMANYHRKMYSTEEIKKKRQTDFSKFLAEETKFPFLHLVYILCERNLLLTLRNPFAFALRFLSTIAVSLFTTTVFSTNIGRRGGCPPQFNAEFEPSQLKQIGDEIESELLTIFNNIGNVFFLVIFMMFNTVLPMSLSFPNELISFRDEKANQWYSMSIFFFGKLAAEIPVNILLVTIFLPISYILQNQPPDLWRFWYIYLVLNLVQLSSVGFALVTGTIFMNNIPAAVFCGPTMFVPFVLFTGVFVKIKSMSKFFISVSYISYLRFGFEGLVVALYGFNRCGQHLSQELLQGKEAFVIWMSAMIGVYDEQENRPISANSTDVAAKSGVASQQFVEELIDKIAGTFISKNNEVRSAVMNIFEFEDWFLQRSLSLLTVYTFVSLTLAYVVVKKRSRIDN